MGADRVAKPRSRLLGIGVGVVIVLAAGGAAAAVAIMNGSIVASTGAITIAVASVGVVIVGLIIAMVAVRDTPPPDEPAGRDERAGAGSDDDARERRSAAADTGEIRFPALADVQQQGPSSRGDDRNLEVFSRIASRLQAKVSRAFVDLDALERKIEDPELLATVFSLDHLVTRIRREVENLAVLGGEVPQNRSKQPAEVNQVLRLAVASTEHYQRIMTYPLRGVKIHGHVVAELINLLAELLDNATAFTPPQAPKITLSASRVAAGLAIEVHDRGIGMPPEDIERVNRLLAGYTDVDLHQLLGEGRIGLAVVHRLAPRHGIRVQLRENIFGGIDAAVVIPHNLLSEPDEMYGVSARAAAARRRLEAGASNGSGSTSGWSQPAREDTSTGQSAGGEPPDWPWPHPQGLDGAVDEGPIGGRHSRPGALNPSPFPRSQVRATGDDDTDPRGSSAPSSSPAPSGSPAPSAEPTETTAATATAARPALPQRKVGNYLRPELRKPHPTVRVSPGHNVDLLADVTRGREDAELENGYGGH